MYECTYTCMCVVFFAKPWGLKGKVAVDGDSDLDVAAVRLIDWLIAKRCDAISLFLRYVCVCV